MNRLSPDQFDAVLRGKEARLLQAVRGALADTLTEAQAEFRKRSSGTLTTGVLRKMRHPYAARAPQTPIDPSVINAQAGRFRNSWRKSGPRGRAAQYRGSVVNVDPNAKYMAGTSKMIRRPIDIYVAGVMRPKYRTRMREALKKSLGI